MYSCEHCNILTWPRIQMSKNDNSMHAKLRAYNFTQGTQEGMSVQQGIWAPWLKAGKPRWIRRRLMTASLFFVVVAQGHGNQQC